ncbi:MAG: hypothetical protein AAF125_02655 [Chloroflexota bacterium]
MTTYTFPYSIWIGDTEITVHALFAHVQQQYHITLFRADVLSEPYIGRITRRNPWHEPGTTGIVESGYTLPLLNEGVIRKTGKTHKFIDKHGRSRTLHQVAIVPELLDNPHQRQRFYATQHQTEWSVASMYATTEA